MIIRKVIKSHTACVTKTPPAPHPFFSFFLFLYNYQKGTKPCICDIHHMPHLQCLRVFSLKIQDICESKSYTWHFSDKKCIQLFYYFCSTDNYFNKMHACPRKKRNKNKNKMQTSIVDLAKK